MSRNYELRMKVDVAPAIAPDVFGVRASHDRTYPVEFVIDDHELGRLVVKVTAETAEIIGHDIRSALVTHASRVPPAVRPVVGDWPWKREPVD